MNIRIFIIDENIMFHSNYFAAWPSHERHWPNRKILYQQYIYFINKNIFNQIFYWRVGVKRPAGSAAKHDPHRPGIPRAAGLRAPGDGLLIVRQTAPALKPSGGGPDRRSPHGKQRAPGRGRQVPGGLWPEWNAALAGRRARRAAGERGRRARDGGPR